MEQVIPEKITELLFVSMTLSVIVSAFLRRVKTVLRGKNVWVCWISNFVASFAIGIPFTLEFYNYHIVEACWVSLFCFIGASSIYDVLEKNSTDIEKANGDTLPIRDENEIKIDGSSLKGE